MYSRLSKKLIFSSFFFVSLIKPIKSAEFIEINKKEQSPTKLSWSKISDKKKPSNSSRLISNINSDESSLEKKDSENDFKSLSQKLNEKKELVIQSDKQFEENNIIYAEGKVSVSYGGKLIRADNIIFDKLNKKISAEGNISLAFGDQIFRMSQLEYNFKKEKGYLLDVKGFINSEKLISDIFQNVDNSDITELNYLLNFQKKEVVNTPGKVSNWIFSADKIIIDGEKWKTKKAILSNDILQFKQVKILLNSLEVSTSKEELRFRSSLNYLVLDENVSIPFWLGNRALSKSEQNFDSKSRWTIGYDNLDKDGLFIGRKLNSINLDNNFILDVEPQFLIQRTLNGKTKSFVRKGDLITEDKVKRNAQFPDYFGFKSQIKGKVDNWDLKIVKQINSFDINKFSDSFRYKSTLNKEINFLNAKWDQSFYGVYRDRVWNGSLGEAEIYNGYGSKLEKKHNWEVKGISNTEILSLGIAHYKGEELSSKNLVESLKGNLFYSIDQNIPLGVDKPKNKIIDNSYEYLYEPITKGLSLNTRLEGSYSFYKNGDHQEHLGFGMGPELIFGNFKNKNFDYTRISLFPFYKLSSGESVFKFDQNYEKFTLNIALDQQLFGPIILKSNGTLNLTNDSDDYGEFIDSKISLNWKKRSYEFGIFYQPHNKAGGISFNLFGFE